MADIITAFDIAIRTIIQPTNLFLILIGTLLGMVLGIIPGIGGSIALALLIPLSFGMDPIVAFMLFAAANGGVSQAGSITSILINTPGGGPNAATLLDGYPMTRQGRGGEAIAASVTASALGAIFGFVILISSMPIMMDLVLLFGPPEIFWLGVWGITMISVVVRGSVLLGLLSAVLGLILAMHGQTITGTIRWTYDLSTLISGFTLIPTLIGLFAISEMINLVKKGQPIAGDISDIGDKSSKWQGVKDVFIHKWIFLRASVIGTIVGMVPGVGGTAANFVAYFQTVQTVDDPEKFGTGDVRGVVSSEAANDAKEGGAYLPTLVLGLPGSASMAVLLGAFILHGITPGPLLIQNHLPIVAIIIVSALLSNILSSTFGLIMTEKLVYITKIDVHVIAPIIIAVGFLGSYAASNNIFKIFVALAFGILGFIMIQVNMSRVPMVLAFILAPIIEANFFRALYISDFNPAIFVSSLVSLGLIILILLSLFLPHIQRIIRERGILNYE